ncbi:uncharacterized protein ColSpa_09818 [Colletotrichum spaethianum]|uniref:Uncharacterized protein n=1 Tax=Colletotrichum spaethianum TaxID=700344 RepID=A0AA37UQX2_9PEZI|nr:uncharacterized protein ColSpa_09818 [Colletotrichum spaethianum]GKT49637.1 hypothetical protein ColSpa_09818 [Colletotrichum spaethianum]
MVYIMVDIFMNVQFSKAVPLVAEQPQTGLLCVNLIVVLHLRVGCLLAQLHLLPKQRAEQPVDGVLLPRPPVLGRHKVLQLLVHVEPHLAALARPPVDVLLRLGLLHRRPPHCGLRRRAVAGVGRALLDKLLEQELVKVGVVVDLRVLVDLARHLRGRAGPRRARTLDEAVGAEELVLEAGNDRRLRRDEVARLDLDVGAARLGGPCLEHLLAVLCRALLGLLDALPDGLVRSRRVVVAALALRAGGLLRELRGEQAGAEAVEGVEQLESGLLGGLVRLRVLLVFFRGGLDGGKGVCGDEGLLEADADVEQPVKGLALLADGEALLRILLGGGGDCGSEDLFFVGGQVGGLGVVELFAARVNVLLCILEHVAVVLVARIVQRIAADASAAVLGPEGNALLFAELALAAMLRMVWIVPDGNIVLGARVLVDALFTAAFVLALLDRFGLRIEICRIM